MPSSIPKAVITRNNATKDLNVTMAAIRHISQNLPVLRNLNLISSIDTTTLTSYICSRDQQTTSQQQKQPINNARATYWKTMTSLSLRILSIDKLEYSLASLTVEMARS